MKKLALAAAVAASLSTGAHAVAVSSTITGAQLWIGTTAALDTTTSTGSATNLQIGGDTATGLTFTGEMQFTAGPVVKLTFDLSGGMRQGANGAGGTLFTAGNIFIATDTGSGFTPYSTVDASVTNLPFLAGMDGHLTTCPSQCTAGLVVDDAGNGTLGGLWNGAFFDPSWNNGASAITLFGNTAGMFLEGSVAPSAVPVPAAAWLFGSALVGLAGIGRKRKLS